MDEFQNQHVMIVLEIIVWMWSWPWLAKTHGLLITCWKARLARTQGRYNQPLIA